MKYIITYLLLMSSVVASELRLDLLQMSRIADDDMYSVNSWEGLQLSYQFDSPLYVFGSIENADVYPIGRSHSLNFLGLGAGIRHNLSKTISVFAQAGYYVVKNDYGHQKGDFNEGAWQYLNQRFRGMQNVDAPFADDQGNYNFAGYEIENDDAFGGTVGIDLLYPVSENFTVGASLSYRSMKVREVISGYFPGYYLGSNTALWEVNMSRNYSTINLGISAGYTF